MVDDVFTMYDTRYKNPNMAADVKEIYDNNEAFHEYVQKHCRTTGDTIEQALRKKIIKEIAKEYEPKGCNYRRENNNGISTK